MLDSIEKNFKHIDITDYVYFTSSPYKRLLSNFLNGIARGVGSAVGVSVVFAIIVIVLKWLAGINIPLISDLLSWLISTIESG